MYIYIYITSGEVQSDVATGTQILNTNVEQVRWGIFDGYWMISIWNLSATAAHKRPVTQSMASQSRRAVVPCTPRPSGMPRSYKQ
jgi:hypothetical protein